MNDYSPLYWELSDDEDDPQLKLGDDITKEPEGEDPFDIIVVEVGKGWARALHEDDISRREQEFWTRVRKERERLELEELRLEELRENYQPTPPKRPLRLPPIVKK